MSHDLIDTAEEDFSEYLVYLKTVQTNVLKVLFDSLKDLVRDVNMIFTPEGVKILEIDEYDTLMVHLFLDKLEVYYCPRTIVIGISIPNLAKLLKNVGTSNNIAMYMTEHSNSVLEIEVDNGDPNQKDEYTMNLMDLDQSTNIHFPDEKYNLVLNMTSADFKNICTTTKAIMTKNIRITHCKGNYTFSAEGEIGTKQMTRRSQTFHDEDDDEEEPVYSNEIYEGVFDLERLNSFTKCASITKYVKIYLENDCPLICEYELPCGDLNLILSPVNELD